MPLPVTPAALAAAVGRYRSADVTCLPTPLQACPRLAKALGHVRILVKRDDLTGLAFGGNKSRQLDLILGSAMADGNDVLVSAATLQSNQCRQLAAAGARIGVPVSLVLRGTRPSVPDANLLLDDLLGANVRTVDEAASQEQLMATVREVMAGLRREGHRPYFVDLLDHRSRDNELGAIAYVGMIVELIDQLGDDDRGPDYVYLSSGSEGSATTAGVLVGLRALGRPTRVVGVNAALQSDHVRHDTLAIARRAAAALELEVKISIRDVVQRRDQVGRGYGHVTADGLDAMRLVARTEGILLDPVYTGKAMAALIADVRSGIIGPGSSVVFIHTGGTPLLFRRDLGSILGASEVSETEELNAS